MRAHSGSAAVPTIVGRARFSEPRLERHGLELAPTARAKERHWIRGRLIAISAAAAALVLAGCAPAGGLRGANSSTRFGRMNLARCELLEPHLYRCPGIEEPLCDPDFARPEVPCLKVTHNGTLLGASSD